MTFPSTANGHGDSTVTQADTTRGIAVDRVFSTEGEHPFDSVSWETRDAAIKNHEGTAIFEQKNV